MRIGSDNALIPRESRIVAVDREGAEMLNVNNYASCREYLGESVVRFDDADATGAGVGDANQTARETKPANIPSGLTFDCRIVTPIDSDSSAAGDPVEAVLRDSIRDANGKVLAPRGARIHGRLAQFAARSRTRLQPATFDVGIETPDHRSRQNASSTRGEPRQGARPRRVGK